MQEDNGLQNLWPHNFLLTGTICCKDPGFINSEIDLPVPPELVGDNAPSVLQGLIRPCWAGQPVAHRTG